MAEKVAQYITWQVIASAVCIVLFAMMGAAWSSHVERFKTLEAKLEAKVDQSRYNLDAERLEKKMDQLINMHLAGTPYRRIDR